MKKSYFSTLLCSLFVLSAAPLFSQDSQNEKKPVASQQDAGPSQKGSFEKAAAAIDGTAKNDGKEEAAQKKTDGNPLWDMIYIFLFLGVFIAVMWFLLPTPDFERIKRQQEERMQRAAGVKPE